MFNVGQKYTLELLDAYDDAGAATLSSITAAVVEVDGPLVMFDIAGRKTIINTHSSIFARATLKS